MITIRPLHQLAELRACIELQRLVWKCSDLDIVPDTVFVVAAKTGGQVIGGFDGELPVGFVLAFPAVSDGKVYLHSHMLAVLPKYQNQGVGRRLKLAQREDALARNIELIVWTFDPLQVKNAHFNIARLGAIVRQYIPDLYGHTSSPLHHGLPTDRLVAEWWLRSKRVQDVLAGAYLQVPPACEGIAVPVTAESGHDVSRSQEQIQAQVREQFEQSLRKGLVVVGFEISQQSGTYLLGPYEN
jgi:predicted GNAT superfamily acetyltransferase